MDQTEMHQVALDLGLEDLIPLWEVAQTCGVAGVHALADEADRANRLDTLMATLVDLLHSQRIRVFVGPWRNDPTEVTGDEANALLLDSRRYIVEQEAAEDLDRVYYVNVENLPH